MRSALWEWIDNALFLLGHKCDARTLRWIGRPRDHQHDFKRVGYGGGGWSLFRCVCGADEINA